MATETVQRGETARPPAKNSKVMETETAQRGEKQLDLQRETAL